MIIRRKLRKRTKRRIWRFNNLLFSLCVLLLSWLFTLIVCLK